MGTSEHETLALACNVDISAHLACLPADQLRPDSEFCSDKYRGMVRAFLEKQVRAGFWGGAPSAAGLLWG